MPIEEIFKVAAALLLPYDPAIGRPSSMLFFSFLSSGDQNRSSLLIILSPSPGSSAFDCRKATVLSRFEKTGNSGSAMPF